MRLKSWIVGLLALMIGMGATTATLAFEDVETDEEAFEEPAEDGEDAWEPEEEEDEVDPWEEDADDDMGEDQEW